QAPHWATTELLRTLIDRNLEQAWDAAGLAIALPLRDLLETCLAQRPNLDANVQYLTPGQAKELAALYNRDLAAIGRRTRGSAPPARRRRTAPSPVPAGVRPPADRDPAGVRRPSIVARVRATASRGGRGGLVSRAAGHAPRSGLTERPASRINARPRPRPGG